MMRRIAFISALACVPAVLAAAAYFGGALRAGATAGIRYVPISPAVFVSQTTMAQWVKTRNERAIDAHAIALWDGLTAPANEVFHGVPLAIYDTWYSPCQIYPAPPPGAPSTCTSQIVNQPTFLGLEPPEQFFHSPATTASDILTSVRYNQEMTAFVDTGYDGSPYTTGVGLVKAIDVGQTNLVDSTAPTAMMLKPTYDLFSSTQPTVIGYWKGPGLNESLGSSTSPLVPGPKTWLTIAVIDPTGKATNAIPRTYCANTVDPAGNVVASSTYVAPPRSYRVIPLSQFYSIPVTASEIGAIEAERAAFTRRQIAELYRRYGRATPAPGCPSVTPPHPVAALVGMHVVTTEQKDVWTWQTFWWNPNARPLPGARRGFQHFDYATAYWKVDRPPYGYRYAFNPYLEGGFGTATFGTTYWPAQGKPGSVINLGITTNCISCHSQAVYAENLKVDLKNIYVAHGSQPQLTLPKSILTRNLWSLGDRAGHP